MSAPKVVYCRFLASAASLLVGESFYRFALDDPLSPEVTGWIEIEVPWIPSISGGAVFVASMVFLALVILLLHGVTPSLASSRGPRSCGAFAAKLLLFLTTAPASGPASSVLTATGSAYSGL